MALDNPLWRYALALYASPGVETSCLELQGQGAAVNRLLLACWLGHRGIALDTDRWQVLDTDWRRAITEPLRQIRYRVRALRAQQPEVEACYHALRQAELAAEQVELMQLWQASALWCSDASCDPEALILANLISYRQLTGHALDETCLRHLARAATELSVEEAELSSGHEH
ncbi:hypothetical protein GCM10009104_30890 [Marinobacterium maritimum]|uniref:TIGR02444 family protein n=1 Tax=Marinobacterium maritimum TaxID=500162 RepID=A0ABN1I9I7_9GAMM